MMKAFASVLFLLIATASSSPAQRLTNAPAAGAVSANSTPSSTAQAPDEMTKKITDLVHAGKYAEAQQLTTGLLVVYPSDQRLIKAKSLLDNLLATSQPLPAPASLAAKENSTALSQLTGMDKVEYNSLIMLARQAQQSVDLAEQEKLLIQFMNQSSSFLKKHPDQMLLWQLRAQIAVSEDDTWAGYQAGQRLLAAGAADSDDTALQSLMGKLKNKGWFESEAAAAAKREEELTNRYGWMQGKWTESFSTPYTYRAPDGFMSSMKTHTNPGLHEWKEEFDFSKSLPVIEAYILDDSGKTKWVPTKFTLDDSGNLRCELYIDQEHAYKQATSCEVDENKRTIAVSVLREGKSEAHLLINSDGAQEGRAQQGGREEGPAVSFSPSAERPAKTAAEASFSPALAGNPVPQSAFARQHSTLSGNSNSRPAIQGAVTAPGPRTPAPAVQADSSSIDLASSQPARPAAPATAILHLYRLSHMGGAFAQYDVEIDGRRVVKIGNAQSVRVDVPAGKHNINATYRSVKSDRPLYDLEMQPGKEYWIRIDLLETFITHMRLAVVPEAEAREESGKLKIIAKGDPR